MQLVRALVTTRSAMHVCPHTSLPPQRTKDASSRWHVNEPTRHAICHLDYRRARALQDIEITKNISILKAFMSAWNLGLSSGKWCSCSVHQGGNNSSLASNMHPGTRVRWRSHYIQHRRHRCGDHLLTCTPLPFLRVPLPPRPFR